jgi:hypothetical protein
MPGQSQRVEDNAFYLILAIGNVIVNQALESGLMFGSTKLTLSSAMIVASCLALAFTSVPPIPGTGRFGLSFTRTQPFLLA